MWNDREKSMNRLFLNGDQLSFSVHYDNKDESHPLKRIKLKANRDFPDLSTQRIQKIPSHFSKATLGCTFDLSNTTVLKTRFDLRHGMAVKASLSSQFGQHNFCGRFLKNLVEKQEEFLAFQLKSDVDSWGQFLMHYKKMIDPAKDDTLEFSLFKQFKNISFLEDLQVRGKVKNNVDRRDISTGMNLFFQQRLHNNLRYLFGCNVESFTRFKPEVKVDLETVGLAEGLFRFSINAGGKRPTPEFSLFYHKELIGKMKWSAKISSQKIVENALRVPLTDKVTLVKSLRFKPSSGGVDDEFFRFGVGLEISI